MLFDFLTENRNTIGIEISSDDILIVETLERDDAYIAVNYLDIDLSHYHHKYRIDNILSEDIINLIIDSIKKHNFYSKNLSISYYSNFNKRFILELPISSKNMLDIILPLEIQKYLRNKHLKFLEEIDFEYSMLDVISQDDKTFQIAVDIFSKRENLLFQKMFRESENTKYNFKICRALQSVTNNINTEDKKLIFNFRKNSIEFSIFHNNNIIYFNSISKGLGMIGYNLKNMFNLSDSEIELLYNNFNEFKKLFDANEFPLENNISIMIGQDKIIMKKIYIENIINTVYNLLSEIQSICNNIIINNNFFDIDKIFIVGDIDSLYSTIVEDIRIIYKKEVIIFDATSNVKTYILEEDKYFKDHKNKFSASILNSLNM